MRVLKSLIKLNLIKNSYEKVNVISGDGCNEFVNVGVIGTANGRS